MLWNKTKQNQKEKEKERNIITERSCRSIYFET